MTILENNRIPGSPFPPNIHIDYSARPGATRLPIIGLDYVLF